jgi:hypothetical protein
MPVNKIKLAILMSLLTGSLFGQINTYSPYSRFGLGELAKPGNGQNLSMGTTGAAYRSNKAINYLNPASYTALDTLSFLFDFGMTASNTKYQSDSLSVNLKNMNIHHISIAFPFTKWWKASVGINPYSAVGYTIMDDSEEIDNIGQIKKNFEGNGGLNQFYMGSSILLMKKFSVGFNYSYLFGYLNNIQAVEFPGNTDFGRPVVDNRITIKGAVYTLGFQYHDIFKDKYTLTLGATYNSKTDLKADKTVSIQNFFPGSSNDFQDDSVRRVVSTNYDLTSIDTAGFVGFPQSYSLGMAIGIKDKFTLMGDYQTQNWADVKIFGKSDSLTNSNSIKLGMEYIPNSQALRGYFNRVHYRLGGYYSNTYIRILGNQLQDYGITFGVGLPFRGTKTTFNLGMVLGQRGTLENNLIKENYGIINVSLTLHDFWFIKRKFD